MSRPRGTLARYKSEAHRHLGWCDDHAIPVLGGRWDLEDPISGLLLASIVQPDSAQVVLSALCSEPPQPLRVNSVWWPSTLMDLVVNFDVEGEAHSLFLEHKHLNSPSNAPGYRTSGGEYWQTESTLLEIDRVREAGETSILGGPFDPSATVHLVVLDARGREMSEIFELGENSKSHRHDSWNTVSYADFADVLRRQYEHDPRDGLVPLLSQLFACERQ